MEVIDFSIHDLVFFQQAKDLKLTTMPAWTKEMLQACCVGIVRRDLFQANLLPIGIRGKQKNQRLAAYLPVNKVIGHLTPQDILQAYLQATMQPIDETLPLWQNLKEIVAIATTFSQEIGLGGSAQFELATQIPMVKATSDLDLIVKNPAKISKKAARDLLNQINAYGIHVDLQILANHNGFSLEEYAFQQTNKIMLKTTKGPILTANPWEDMLKFR